MESQQDSRAKRRILPAILLVAGLLIAVASGWWLLHSPGGRATSGESMSSQSYAHTEIGIDGMDCLMCAAGLQNNLRALPGVLKAEVSYQDKRALVEFNPTVVDRARLEKAIEGAGFKVTGLSSRH